MFVILLSLCLFNNAVKSSYNVIDVDDILSDDFMPGTLLVLENPKTTFTDFNASLGKPLKLSGSLDNAMNLMSFHRSKMNEYLCRSYIAEQIVNDMTQSRIKRKMDIGGTKSDKLSPQTNLLKDEGSTNYKDWLSKSTTLEDIYRHYNNDKHIERKQDEEEEKDEEEYDSHVVGYAFQPNSSPSKLGHSGSGFYPGGYSYSGSYPYHQGGYSTGMSGHGTGGGGHTGYEQDHEEEQHLHHVIHEVPKYVYHEEKYSTSEKDHDLADLFEIALTALAFLSFGMFIIHVIMCITMTNSTTTTTAANMVMMPMSMSPTAEATGMGMPAGGGTDAGGDASGTNEGGDDGGGGTGGGGNIGPPDNTGGGYNSGGDGDENNAAGATATGTGMGGTASGAAGDDGDAITATGDEGTATGAETASGIRDTIKFRFRRDIPSITNPNNQALNELARKILTSVDSALIANADNGNCLRKSLCENNKFSREIPDRLKKYLLPMWSLGMSWISGRLVRNNVPPATIMLDSLKASIIGLGNGNCEIIYQNCDMKKSKRESRKRRRRNIQK